MDISTDIKKGTKLEFMNWNKEKGYYKCEGRVLEDQGRHWLIQIAPNHNARMLKDHCVKCFETNGEKAIAWLNLNSK